MPATDGVKVALVYPPYGPVRNEPGIKTVKENYGIFPSLSLLYVAGILERAGCEVLFGRPPSRCEPCPDGRLECVTMVVEELEGTLIEGLYLEEVP